MKFILVFVFALFLFPSAVSAQGHHSHKVEKGETVVSISKKYQITPYDIYRLNPDARNGIQLGSTLLIPDPPVKPLPAGTPVKEVPTKVVNTIHKVEAKETLYSISKKYNITPEALEKANTALVKDGLKAGDELIIPIKGSGVAAQAAVAEKQIAAGKGTTYMYHTVEAGETVYSIAKTYGMTVQLVEELNPEVKDSLPLGFKLKLAKNAVIAESKVPQVAPVNTGVVKPSNPPVEDLYIDYTVQPKETIYSLSKRSGLTEPELISLNPEIKDGLRDGMVIKLPKDSGTFIPGQVASLQSSLVKTKPKKLALLLPFNTYRIESDTVRGKLLRTDKLLNLTLDFYAGALVAIDSAKTLGLPLDVKILDAKETSPRSSDVATLKGQLTGVNAVIGPFFQTNTESAALLMPNAAVISPLAKDTGRALPNLYYSIPTDDIMRKALFDYIRSKEGNVIAIIDKKKTASRDFIKANYTAFRIIDAGSTAEAIKALLVAGKTNYVILDAESLAHISGALRILTDAQKDYTIQLALPDKTERYDHDEVALDKLVKLKLLYPSITRDDNDAQHELFAKVFREKNGFNPTAYAIRGFDITFDTILRLFQEEDFKTTMAQKNSEQVENKFMYLSQAGGNYNNGVYIMQFEEGLNVIKAQ
ncbi:LysM peptidoglycan-binding domain-containing protein [Flavobacterium sp. RHBU_24]|uniref:LysM peptidoglycan-binding domain-containing protein n=1 Tax=Flavobacterium sp. RHBU_24 TaxID=3391185 RepID=UPI0039850B3D